MQKNKWQIESFDTNKNYNYPSPLKKSYVPNNSASKYLKLKLSDIQKQYDKTMQLFQL